MPNHDDKKKEPRELFDIEVNEVSIVDRPANRRKFLIIKRQEQEDNMATFEAEPRDELEIEKAKAKEEEDEEMKKAKAKEEEEDMKKAKAKEDEEEMEKAMPAELKSAIQAVVPWMKKQAGMEGAPAKEVNMVAMFLGKVAGGQYPYPSPKQKTETKKSEDPDEIPAVQVMQDGSVVVSGRPIDLEKSRKRLTPSRVDTIKDVVSKLVALLNGVDPDAIKSVLSKAMDEEEEEDKKKGAKQDEDEKGVKKSVDQVSEKLEHLVERIQKIEDARAPSKRENGDEKTDTTVEKGKKNFWNGVL